MWESERPGERARELAEVAFGHAFHYLEKGTGSILSFVVVESGSEVLMPPRGDPDPRRDRGLLLYLAEEPEELRQAVRARRPALSSYAIGWKGSIRRAEEEEKVRAFYAEVGIRGETSGRLFVQPWRPAERKGQFLRLGPPLIQRATVNLLA